MENILWVSLAPSRPPPRRARAQSTHLSQTSLPSPCTERNFPVAEMTSAVCHAEANGVLREILAKFLFQPEILWFGNSESLPQTHTLVHMWARAHTLTLEKCIHKFSTHRKKLSWLHRSQCQHLKETPRHPLAINHIVQKMLRNY